MTTPATGPQAGLKAKANELGLKAYMAAPPKAQTAILTGVGKAQPVIAKLQPHGKKILGGVVGVLAVRKLRK